MSILLTVLLAQVNWLTLLKCSLYKTETILNYSKLYVYWVIMILCQFKWLTSTMTGRLELLIEILCKRGLQFTELPVIIYLNYLTSGNLCAVPQRSRRSRHIKEISRIWWYFFAYHALSRGQLRKQNLRYRHLIGASTYRGRAPKFQS